MLRDIQQAHHYRSDVLWCCAVCLDTMVDLIVLDNSTGLLSTNQLLGIQICGLPFEYWLEISTWRGTGSMGNERPAEVGYGSAWQYGYTQLALYFAGRDSSKFDFVWSVDNRLAEESSMLQVEI